MDDRAYPSLKLFKKLEQNSQFYLMKVAMSFYKEIVNAPNLDQIVTIKRKYECADVQVVKFVLSVECFTGKSVTAVMQDFYASIFMLNFAAIAHREQTYKLESDHTKNPKKKEGAYMNKILEFPAKRLRYTYHEINGSNLIIHITKETRRCRAIMLIGTIAQRIKLVKSLCAKGHSKSEISLITIMVLQRDPSIKSKLLNVLCMVATNSLCLKTNISY